MCPPADGSHAKVSASLNVIHLSRVTRGGSTRGHPGVIAYGPLDAVAELGEDLREGRKDGG